jgi:hypothetical protein
MVVGKRCLWCGESLERGKYCSNSHKSSYFQRLRLNRIKRIDAKTYEHFRGGLLKGTVSVGQYYDLKADNKLLKRRVNYLENRLSLLRERTIKKLDEQVGRIA